MEKVVFDTNIVLDAAMERKGSEDPLRLIQAVINEEIIGMVTVNTITDIHYIVKKRLGESVARTAVQNILYVFDVIPVDAESCMDALSLPMTDYEDAILAACAAREKADYILTGDMGFLNAESPVRVMTPGELLRVLDEKEEKQ